MSEGEGHRVGHFGRGEKFGTPFGSMLVDTCLLSHIPWMGSGMKNEPLSPQSLDTNEPGG